MPKNRQKSFATYIGCIFLGHQRVVGERRFRSNCWRHVEKKSPDKFHLSVETCQMNGTETSLKQRRWLHFFLEFYYIQMKSFNISRYCNCFWLFLISLNKNIKITTIEILIFFNLFIVYKTLSVRASLGIFNDDTNKKYSYSQYFVRNHVIFTQYIHISWNDINYEYFSIVLRQKSKKSLIEFKQQLIYNNFLYIMLTQTYQ